MDLLIYQHTFHLQWYNRHVIKKNATTDKKELKEIENISRII